MSSEKLFGRYDELIRLLLGFALTGIVGTYLAQTYTTKQANLVTAGKIFSGQSELMGNRYFVMNRITNAYEDNKAAANAVSADDIKSRWQEYKSVLQKWNSSRGYNREMVRLYFGNVLWEEERQIHYLFRAWGQSLEAEYRQPDSVDLACVDKNVNILMSKIHSFQFQMAAAIQAGKIGPGRDQSKVTVDKPLDAWCLVTVAGQISAPNNPAAAQ